MAHLCPGLAHSGKIYLCTLSAMTILSSRIGFFSFLCAHQCSIGKRMLLSSLPNFLLMPRLIPFLCLFLWLPQSPKITSPTLTSSKFPRFQRKVLFGFPPTFLSPFKSPPPLARGRRRNIQVAQMTPSELKRRGQILTTRSNNARLAGMQKEEEEEEEEKAWWSPSLPLSFLRGGGMRALWDCVKVSLYVHYVLQVEKYNFALFRYTISQVLGTISQRLQICVFVSNLLLLRCTQTLLF